MGINPVKDKYDELLKFYQTWIPKTLNGINIYLVGQAAPRPENPYVSFNPIVSVESLGLQDERRFNDDGSEYLRGQRYITSELYAYSDAPTRYDGLNDAWSILQQLRFSLGFPQTERLLDEITCRVVDDGEVQNVSQTLNTTNEPRSQLQIKYSTVIKQDIDSGEIKTINEEGTIDGTWNPYTLNISVTKP